MELVDHAAFQIVGLDVEAPFEELSTLVPAAWEGLLARAGEIHGRTRDTFVELSIDLGQGRYREIVGAQVDAGTHPPDGMAAELVHLARWVHEVHRGPLESIGDTFRRMLVWAAERGHEPDGVKLDVGYGADGPHDLFVRLATP